MDWDFVRISPREAKSQISSTLDIFLTASRGENLTKTQPHTWGNSWANYLARQFAQFFPLVCGRLKKAKKTSKIIVNPGSLGVLWTLCAGKHLRTQQCTFQESFIVRLEPRRVHYYNKTFNRKPGIFVGSDRLVMNTKQWYGYVKLRTNVKPWLLFQP